MKKGKTPDKKVKLNNLTKEVKFNQQGLIPAIIQDIETDEVLMLGYMNKKALVKTMKTNKVWFWSRSRNKLWLKGETSGNYQLVREMKMDCDKDAILLKVSPQGPICHTGKKSCFYNKLNNKINSGSKNGKKVVRKNRKNDQGNNKVKLEQSFIIDLYDIILDRKNNPRSDSYTSGLFLKGIDRIAKKIGEEAGEVIIAGKNEDKDEIIYESADLIYHLLILMVLYNINIADIVDELERRHSNN